MPCKLKKEAQIPCRYMTFEAYYIADQFISFRLPAMSGSDKRVHSSAETFSRSMFESRTSAVDRTRSFKVFVIVRFFVFVK